MSKWPKASQHRPIWLLSWTASSLSGCVWLVHRSWLIPLGQLLNFYFQFFKWQSNLGLHACSVSDLPHLYPQPWTTFLEAFFLLFCTWRTFMNEWILKFLHTTGFLWSVNEWVLRMSEFSGRNSSTLLGSREVLMILQLSHLPRRQPPVFGNEHFLLG